MAIRVGNKTADIAGRAREATDGLAERARQVTIMAGASFGKGKWPSAGACDSAHVPERSITDKSREPAVNDDEATNEATHEKNVGVAQAAHDPR